VRRDLLLYRLTLEAQKRIAKSPLSSVRSCGDLDVRRAAVSAARPDQLSGLL